jgi:hypothetical protein
MAEYQITNDAINGLKTYKMNLSKAIMTAILGFSFRHIPVNTGHMMRQTKMIQDGEEGFALVTRTHYAKQQYTERLYHYIVNGEYKSIGNVLIGFSAMEARDIKSRKGKEKFQYSYWLKYWRLRDADKLTQQTGMWFHRAHEEVMREGISPLTRSALVKSQKDLMARKAAMQDIIIKQGNV